jgi:hypothetical protein
MELKKQLATIKSWANTWIYTTKQKKNTQHHYYQQQLKMQNEGK